MNPTKIDMVKEFYAAAKSSEWNKVKQYCHEYFVIHESAALPYAGEYSGIDGFKQLVRKVFVDTFSELEVNPKYYTESANCVMVLIEIRGRGKKNNKEFTSEIVEVVEFEENKIKTIKPFYWDQNLIKRISEY